MACGRRRIADQPGRLIAVCRSLDAAAGRSDRTLDRGRACRTIRHTPRLRILPNGAMCASPVRSALLSVPTLKPALSGGLFCHSSATFANAVARILAEADRA